MDEQKKVWTTPQLVIHGDVEKLTAEGQNPPAKRYGSSDGAVWNGQSVHWAS